MVNTKKSITILSLVVIVLLGTAATTNSGVNFQNLQVLPKDISEKRLDSLMETFNKALKVNCDFCHSKAINLVSLTPVTDKLDFAADNSMKESARKMIRMTIDINRTSFNYDTTGRPDYLRNVVSCNTCHRGNPYPDHE